VPASEQRWLGPYFVSAIDDWVVGGEGDNEPYKGSTLTRCESSSLIKAGSFQSCFGRKSRNDNVDDEMTVAERLVRRVQTGRDGTRRAQRDDRARGYLIKDGWRQVPLERPCRQRDVVGADPG
jgi:hypothetical protein